MKTNIRRIAINVGAGYVPGINAVITGASIAAGKMGWEVVGIRDGFAGLLQPERYPDGGLVTLSPELIENLDPSAGGVLGQSARIDPFHVRQINELEMVEEVDMSDELLKRLQNRKYRWINFSRWWTGINNSLQAPSQRSQYGVHPTLDR